MGSKRVHYRPPSCGDAACGRHEIVWDTSTVEAVTCRRCLSWLDKDLRAKLKAVNEALHPGTVVRGVVVPGKLPDPDWDY